MARGKYSPTVQTAYRTNQKWFDNYAQGNQYDPEGYDSYGYDEKNFDRAKNHENDYLLDDSTDEEGNFAYDFALDHWTFDGVKPVHVMNVKKD